jgi:hypothetical protein
MKYLQKFCVFISDYLRGRPDLQKVNVNLKKQNIELHEVAKILDRLLKAQTEQIKTLEALNVVYVQQIRALLDIDDKDRLEYMQWQITVRNEIERLIKS